MNAQMRTAFGRLGLTIEASIAVVDEQGIDTVKNFCCLRDGNIEKLCKIIRRPGGTMPNPNAGIAGQPATINNPGVLVSLIGQTNMKLASFWLHYQELTSRLVTPADITLPNLRSIKSLKEWHDNHKSNPDPPEGIVDAANWPKTIESIKEYLKICVGVNGVPLAYVVRKEPTVPPQTPTPQQTTIQNRTRW